MQKLKIFLSSAQFGNEFSTEREALPVIFLKEPLVSSFFLWVIEGQASPSDIRRQYRENLEDSEGLILLLGTELRDAVKDEFDIAVEKEIPVFAFKKASCKPTPAMLEFISNRVQKYCVVYDYTSFDRLTASIQDVLLSSFRKTRAVQRGVGDIVDIQPTTDEERTLHLLVGVLESDQAVMTKERVIEALLLEVLGRTQQGCTVADLKVSVKQLIRGSGEMLGGEIEPALKRLGDEGRINFTAGGRYSLVGSARTELRDRATTTVEEDDEMYREFFKSQSRSLEEGDFGVYRRTLDRCISRILYANGRQRFYCKECRHSFSIHNKGVKRSNEFIWFKEWLCEGYTVSQLSRIR